MLWEKALKAKNQYFHIMILKILEFRGTVFEAKAYPISHVFLVIAPEDDPRRLKSTQGQPKTR